MIWMIFFVRLLLLYLIFNSIFLLLYSFSGRVEVAFFLGVFLPMMGLFLDFGVFDLTNCMEIYEDFYGERGMDLLQCVLDTFKQLFCIIILHWTSLIVFEKRDILDEKG